MKIAFDVMGTIKGPKKEQVLKMFKLFQEAGHEVIVWSNSFGYAVDAINDNNLTNTEPRDKRMKMDVDYEENRYVDIAIEDDRRQTWLAAKKFIWVDEIPIDMVDVDALVKELLGDK